MTGQTVSHYRILEKLGEGGMGVVYRAEDNKLRRTVALKFLHSGGNAGFDRFLREAQAAAALSHPNICTIFEIDEEHGFIAMEFVAGGSLQQKIGVRPLKFDEALEIARQTCEGLQAAHEMGVVHRDIKPGNLMLTAQGQVKITDFGLARIEERTRITKTGSSLGTPAYMSPEQAEGKPSDHRADIWSLAVVLYEMLSGRVPFEAENEHATIYAIINSEPEPVTALRTGLLVEIDRIIAKAMAKSPENRYQHASDLAVDLRALQTARAGIAAGAQLPASSGKPRWRKAAIAAALFSIAITATWYFRPADSWENPLANARYTRLTNFDGAELGAAISADGRLVTFLSDHGGQFDAWVGQIGSSDFVNLTKGQLPDLFHDRVRTLSFSGDGTAVSIRVEPHKIVADAPSAVTWTVPTLGGMPRPFLENAIELAWSPDGQRIAHHQNKGGDAIHLSDWGGANPTKLYARDPGLHCHYLSWSPDGKFIYFVSGLPPDEMDVWRIPSAGGDAEQITNHRSRVAYPTLLDNRTLLYIASADDGSGSCIYAMDLRKRIAKRVSSGIEQYTSLAADYRAPGTARRLVATLTNHSGSLWRVPILDGIASEKRAVPHPIPSPQATNPRITPGYLLYLSSTGYADGLWKFSRESVIELWKATQGGLSGAPAVAPGGRQICFTYRKQDKSGLALMNADGTNMRLLTTAFQARGAPSWSPDGEWIVVGGDEGMGGRIFKVPVNGGKHVRLIDTLSYLPIWSPSGRFIIYSGADVGARQPVKAMTPDGQPFPLPEVSRLSAVASTDSYRFLPDASGVVLVQGHFRNQNFWLLDFATGKLRQLTDLHPGYTIRGFDIAPNGKEIFFDRVRENSDIVLIELPAL